MTNQKELVSICTNLLLCQVCKRIPSVSPSRPIPRRPIFFQCEIGHTICGDCRVKLQECSFAACDSKVTNIPNLLAEEILLKFYRRCKFACEGCEYVIFEGELQELEHHQNDCNFKLLKCNLHLITAVGNVICGEEWKPELYASHVLFGHNANKVIFPEDQIDPIGAKSKINQIIPFQVTQNMDLDWVQVPIQYMHFSGKDFWLVTRFEKFNTYWWMYHLETDNLENLSTNGGGNYWAVITLLNPVTKVAMSFTGPTYSIRKTSQDIINSRLCLIVNRATLQALTHYNNKSQSTTWTLITSISQGPVYSAAADAEVKTASELSSIQNEFQDSNSLEGSGISLGTSEQPDKLNAVSYDGEGTTLTTPSPGLKHNLSTAVPSKTLLDSTTSASFPVPKNRRERRLLKLQMKTQVGEDPSFVLNQHVLDHKSAKIWVPPHIQLKHASKLSENKTLSKEDIVKRTRGILNKLTPANFDKLALDLANLDYDDNDDWIAYVILMIFEKAISDSVSASLYAKMINTICNKSVRNAKKFRKNILDQCQKEFQKGSNVEDKIRTIKVALTDAPDKSKRAELQLELENKISESKRRSLGNIRLMGELYKLGMLTSRTMIDCIQILLGNKDEESYEGLCVLLTVTGKMLDHQLMELETIAQNGTSTNAIYRPSLKFIPPEKFMNKTFALLKTLCCDPKLSIRIRFALLNITDLRESWLAGDEQFNKMLPIPQKLTKPAANSLESTENFEKLSRFSVLSAVTNILPQSTNSISFESAGIAPSCAPELEQEQSKQSNQNIQAEVKDVTRNSIIHLAVEANCDMAVGICTVRTDGAPVISYTNGPFKQCLPKGTSDVKFQVQNAISALSVFQVHFKPNSTVYITCTTNLKQTGSNKSEAEKLYQELENLLVSKCIKKYTLKGGSTLAETKAALSLLSNNSSDFEKIMSKIVGDKKAEMLKSALNFKEK